MFPGLRLLHCYGANAASTVESYRVDFTSENTTATINTAAMLLIPSTPSTPFRSVERWFTIMCISTQYAKAFASFTFWGLPERVDFPENRITFVGGVTGAARTPTFSKSNIATGSVHKLYWAPTTNLKIPGTLSAPGSKTKYLVLQLVVATKADVSDFAYLFHLNFSKRD